MTAPTAAQRRSEQATDKNATAIRPFRVNVSEADLDDLRRWLYATRWPDKETVADESQGVQRDSVLAWLRILDATDGGRLGVGAHRPCVGRPDEAPGVHALRCAGRRLGSGCRRTMGRQAPSGLLGIHTNLPAAITNDVGAALGGAPVPAGFSEQERAAVDDLRTYLQTGGLAYLVMMGARPQAVGYGLTDSPAGLAGWMLVHGGFTKWSYGKDPNQSPTRDDVLDNFTLYWLTNTAASSARIYWENRGRDLVSAAAQKTDEISIPVAVTVFPDEVVRVQESWARRAFRNLIYFRHAGRGGHFAMWEHPELFAAELRAAFKSLR